MSKTKITWIEEGWYFSKNLNNIFDNIIENVVIIDNNKITVYYIGVVTNIS
jgi:hypothetical protein